MIEFASEQMTQQQSDGHWVGGVWVIVDLQS